MERLSNVGDHLSIRYFLKYKQVGRYMPVILGKSKALVPRGIKEIKYIGHIEKKATDMAVRIAKEFGEQSKKIKPKKVFFR